MKTADYEYFPVRQTSAEWHSLRAGKLTASLAAACCGASPWMSPQSAYRQIVGQENHVSNWFMEHGREMEPVAVARYEVETGLLTRECGFYVSAERPWLGASPDRTVGKDGLLEVKCSAKVHSDPAPSWLIQATVQLYCAGRVWCDICHFRDGEIAVWRVNRTLQCAVLTRLDHYYQTYLQASLIPPRRSIPRWEIPQATLANCFARSV